MSEESTLETKEISPLRPAVSRVEKEKKIQVPKTAVTTQPPHPEEKTEGLKK